MSASFLALPTTILAIIWDYCGANDILALASTCEQLYTEIDSFMLVINAQITNETIPIFLRISAILSF
jgi:hypothetical protein